MTPLAPLSQERAAQLNARAGLASVSVAIVLVVTKLWALAQTSSLSIAASLADSALDLMVALGALLAIRYAARPPDDDHRFGHTSAEDLAALGQSLFILISCVLLVFASIRRLITAPQIEMTREGQGIGVMVLSIVLTLALVTYQRRVARATGSKVVFADSLHYIGDLIPAIGAIIALGASAQLGLNHIDSFVALGAAALLAVGAIRVWKASWDALMDRSAPQSLIDDVCAMAEATSGIEDYHDLKTRMAGSKPFINLHIELDGDQSLREAHAICAALEADILARYPSADVIVHMDVAGEAD